MSSPEITNKVGAETRQAATLKIMETTNEIGSLTGKMLADYYPVIQHVRKAYQELEEFLVRIIQRDTQQGGTSAKPERVNIIEIYAAFKKFYKERQAQSKADQAIMQYINKTHALWEEALAAAKRLTGLKTEGKEMILYG